jgi:hypothetical protein
MAMNRVEARPIVDFLAAFLMVAILASGLAAHAQTEDQAWLRYAGGPAHSAIPVSVRALGTNVLERSAVEELQRGIAGMSGNSANAGETVVGTLDEVRAAFPGLGFPLTLQRTDSGSAGPCGTGSRSSSSRDRMSTALSLARLTCCAAPPPVRTSLISA